MSTTDPRLVVYASDNALSEKEDSISSVINNQVSSMSSQWRAMNALPLEFAQVTPGFAME